MAKIIDSHILFANELDNVIEIDLNKMIIDIIGKQIVNNQSISLSLLENHLFRKYTKESLEFEGPPTNQTLWIFGLICASDNDQIRTKVTQILPIVVKFLESNKLSTKSEALTMFYNLSSNFECKFTIELLQNI